MTHGRGPGRSHTRPRSWLATYAAVRLYWAVSGTALLATAGGTVRDIARHGGLPTVVPELAAAALKLADGPLAFALILGVGWTRRSAPLGDGPLHLVRSAAP